MKLKLLIYLIFISTNLTAQNMIPSEILSKVFLIKYGVNTGTCFMVSVDSNDYIITAKHLFPNALTNKSPVEVEILKDSTWVKISSNYSTHSNQNIDIAVLDLKSNDIKSNFFDLDSKGFYLSQDCFFLGFPYGLRMEDSERKLNNGFPIPFVKKAIISSFTYGNMGQIYLDGHNNPGFSGGPVVITNTGSDNKNKMKIIGVISAYVNEEKITKTPFGDIKNSENSGIVLSYASDHIIEIIKSK